MNKQMKRWYLCKSLSLERVQNEADYFWHQIHEKYEYVNKCLICIAKWNLFEYNHIKKLKISNDWQIDETFNQSHFCLSALDGMKTVCELLNSPIAPPPFGLFYCGSIYGDYQLPNRQSVRSGKVPRQGPAARERGRTPVRTCVPGLRVASLPLVYQLLSHLVSLEQCEELVFPLERH